MESLLAVAFDNISSKDNGKIRKGLRQIEGLLAQICLSKASNSSPMKRKPSTLMSSDSGASSKQLEALGSDLAFREFFRLQEGFEWNVATRLVTTLERLLSQRSTGANDLLIISVLSLLQGLLLLHPPSRTLYTQETYMNSLLDLLDPCNCPTIQSSALLVLVAALIDQPRNIRTLERIDGLLTITSLFKSRGTTQEVKLKVVEFLYFYLMPEAAPTTSATASPMPPGALHRSPSKVSAATARSMMDGGGGGGAAGMPKAVKSTQEKQRLLGKYLSNVEDLVQDLRENAPFGGVMV